MTHRCHARECEVEVPPEMLMCRTHWFRVPRHIRQAVWANYRRGQCDDKNPSEEWHEAADAAIGFVAWSDGLPTTASEKKALEKFGLELS